MPRRRRPARPVANRVLRERLRPRANERVQQLERLGLQVHHDAAAEEGGNESGGSHVAVHDDLDGILKRRLIDPCLLIDQLEWADYLIGRNPEGFYNPAGCYVTVLRDNVPVPSTFETSRLRAMRGAAHAQSERREARLSELRIAYDQYCAAEVDRHIENTFSAEEFARLVDEQKRHLLGSKRPDFTRWRAEQLDEYAAAHVRRAVSRDATVPTFDQFVETTRGGALS